MFVYASEKGTFDPVSNALEFDTDVVTKLVPSNEDILDNELPHDHPLYGIHAVSQKFKLMLRKAVASPLNANVYGSEAVCRALREVVNANLLNRLLVQVRGSGLPDVACTCCEMLFESRRALQRHKEQMQCTNRSLACQICQKRVRSTTALMTHLRTHFE